MRSKKTVKPRSHFANLSDEQVREIRKLIAYGCPQRLVARSFQVSQSAIHNIVAGKTYRQVKVA